MKRSGFARPAPRVKQYTGTNASAPRAPLPRMSLLGRVFDELVVPILKSEPMRSEEYRRLVAALPCVACGIVGHSQAAHPNTGKGAGTKTDDRLCFPLCADRPSVRGCHSQFDQGALFSKIARREIEPAWGADTRRRIEAMGQWPARLPRWTE